MRSDESDDWIFVLVLVERLACVVLAFILLLHLLAGGHQGWQSFAIGYLVATSVLMVTWAMVDSRPYLPRLVVHFKSMFRGTLRSLAGVESSTLAHLSDAMHFKK
jgi:hypothetical protein